MRIDSNNLSIARLLSQTTRAIDRSLERLGSGQRIVHPRDDLAGHSQVVRLEAQSRGLAAVARGLNQSISAIQIASSGLEQQLELIQRMREIAVQASSGTLSQADRDRLQDELGQLLETFSDISNSSVFGELHLLDGSVNSFETLTSDRADSSLEIELPNSTDSETFILNRATGVYSRNQTIGVSVVGNKIPKLGDVDNDGDLDLLVLNVTNSRAEIYSNDGSGSFSLSSSFQVSNLSNHELGDFDGNGILDVVVGLTNSTANIYLGSGDGTFGFARSMSTPGGATALAIADVDDDGNMDLLAGGSYLTIHWGLGDGSFSGTLTKTVAPTEIDDISVGDIDGDGRRDIVVNSWADSGIFAVTNQDSRTFSGSQLLFTPFGTLDDAKIVDLDNDGDLDIVTSDVANGSISGILNNGLGSFASASAYDLGAAAPSEIEVADLNRDGIVDVVGIDSSGGINTLLSNGLLSYTQVNSSQGASGQEFLSVGDIDGDGVSDLVIGNSGSFTRTYLSTTQEDSAVSQVDVRTQSKAQLTLSILDSAVEKILSRQSALSGLYQRLESNQSSALLLKENVDIAKSQSADADLALETSELVKNQILQQAQVAVMAQANLQLQNVLQLFDL